MQSMQEVSMQIANDYIYKNAQKTVSRCTNSLRDQLKQTVTVSWQELKTFVGLFCVNKTE